jgi:putative oxidoreductase
MRLLIGFLLGWTERTAHHFDWLAPLVARLVVGYVFMLSGWGKLHHLPEATQNFSDWGIPLPQIVTPFVSGVEWVGGAFLLVGLLTRMCAAALAITMLVAIRTALWDQVDSLEILLGFEEVAYLALFFWLAVAGAGPVSLDRWLTRRAVHSK